MNGSSGRWLFSVVTGMKPPINAPAPPCAGVGQWGDLSLAHPPACPLEPLLGTKCHLPKAHVAGLEFLLGFGV